MADYVPGNIYLLTAERVFYCVGVDATNATFVSASDNAAVFTVAKTIPAPPIPLYLMQLDSAPPAGFVNGATVKSSYNGDRFTLVAPLEDVGTQTLKVCSLHPDGGDVTRVVFADTTKLELVGT